MLQNFQPTTCVYVLLFRPPVGMQCTPYTRPCGGTVGYLFTFQFSSLEWHSHILSSVHVIIPDVMVHL